MNRLLTKLALGSLAGAGIALCGNVMAQTTTVPAATQVVSSSAPTDTDAPNGNSNIEAVKSETKTEATEGANITVDPATLLPDLRPVPVAKATLVGGTIEKLDRVRDQMTLSIFGGGHMKVLFDPRTRIYLKGVDGTTADLHQGERVSIDTILDGTTVFARSIRVRTAGTMGESQGTVLNYRADRGELTMRDAISPTPLHVRLNSSTQIVQGEHKVSAGAMVPGSLISLQFSPAGDGHEVAKQISILALPGTSFTFAGQIENLDLHTGLIVLYSSTDRKTYEIYLDPSAAPDENLRSGAVVTVVANFDGSRYVARSLNVDGQK